MILPFAKLGTLVLRTLSKPLASRLKTQAAHHPRFRQSIINFAQANHKFQVNVQRRIYGHATNVEIRPLDEDKAVQAASDFLGEFVIFSVGGGVIVFEVQRSARSEARKEAARAAEVEGLRREVAGLAERLEILENAAKGRSSLSSWTPLFKSESKETQTTRPEPGYGRVNVSSNLNPEYGRVNVSSNSNFSKWPPKQPV